MAASQGLQRRTAPAKGTGDLFSVLYDELAAAFSQMNPIEIKETAIKLLALVVGTSTLVSLIPFESNFGAFAAGSIIADAARPLVSRLIAQPAEVWLRRGIRYGALPPRTALSMIADGIVAPEVIDELAVESDIADKWIPLLRKYGEFKRSNVLLDLKHSYDKGVEDLQAHLLEQKIAESTADLTKAENAIDGLEVEVLSQSIAHDVEPIQRIANALETTTFLAETTTGKAHDRAVGRIAQLLIVSSQFGEAA